MWAIRPLLKKHFRRRIADVVVMNLSRLAAQWEEVVNGSIVTLEGEAIQRLDGLIATVENLIVSTDEASVGIRADLVRLGKLRGRLGCGTS